MQPINGRTLRVMRHLMGYTTREMGKALGYSHVYIQLLERGERPITREVEKRFRALLINLLSEKSA